MVNKIRKLTVGIDYKNAMNYTVGQAVYGGHTISAILDEGEKFSIYIESEAQQKIWKDVYKTMGVSVEFDLDD